MMILPGELPQWLSPTKLLERLRRRALAAPGRRAAYERAKRVAGGEPRNCGSRQQRRREAFLIEFKRAGGYDLPRRARRRIARARARASLH
jgi:hypothetical protein